MSQRRATYQAGQPAAPEDVLLNAHAMLDNENVPRHDRRGRVLSLTDRMAILLGRTEAEKRAAWSSGLMGGLKDR